MPNQTDFDKVNKFVIQPMKRHWQGDMDADTVDDFVRSLAKYSERELANAMDVMLRTQKNRRPTIAHITEELHKGQPLENQDAANWYKQRQKENEQKTDDARKAALDVINTPEGMKSIDGFYYTELFGYLFDTALSQIVKGKPVKLEIPDLIPIEWTYYAAQRKETFMRGK